MSGVPLNRGKLFRPLFDKIIHKSGTSGSNCLEKQLAIKCHKSVGKSCLGGGNCRGDVWSSYSIRGRVVWGLVVRG